jgi:hypothetical protein
MTNKKEDSMDAVLKPARKDVENLLEMFEFFLTERQLDKSIEALGESVRDMRLIIGRLLVDHFLSLSTKAESKFCSSLASMLADRAEALPGDGEDQEYVDYCIAEILTAFEYAEEIKLAYSDDPVLQKMLAMDIPVLRPFDYGIRGRMKLVSVDKRRKIHTP